MVKILRDRVLSWRNKRIAVSRKVGTEGSRLSQIGLTNCNSVNAALFFGLSFINFMLRFFEFVRK